jgi:uncharacterized protein involved in type VI secretion and phage assembly
MDLAAVFAPQHQRLFKFVTPLQDQQELLLDSFSGHEGLSQLFSFELELISQQAFIELKTLMGAPAQLHSRDTGQLIDSEEFRYDAAANRLNFNTSQFDQVKDNRIKQWRDQTYSYDPWGNLVEKRSG